jgi:hypothetical protein
MLFVVQLLQLGLAGYYLSLNNCAPNLLSKIESSNRRFCILGDPGRLRGGERVPEDAVFDAIDFFTPQNM